MQRRLLSPSTVVKRLEGEIQGGWGVSRDNDAVNLTVGCVWVFFFSFSGKKQCKLTMEESLPAKSCDPLH